MKDHSLALAVSTIVCAVLGAGATLALVLTRIVISQALWIVSPYLALGVLGFCCRKRAALASITLIAAVVIAVLGFYAFLVEERDWAINFVPLCQWGGCVGLSLVLLFRRQ